MSAVSEACEARLAPEATREKHYLEVELYELVRTDPRIFDFLQSGALDGVWYLDVENQEEEWLSPRFKAVLGYEDDEIEDGTGWWEKMVHPDDLAKTINSLERHLSNPAEPYDEVVRYRHKNGETLWVRCRGMAIRDESGSPTRMLGAHTNVTEQTKALLELERANATLKEEVNARRVLESELVQAQKLEAIGQLAAGIAHEINTPIQYVGGNLSFLSDAFRSAAVVIGKARALVDANRDCPECGHLVVEIERLLRHHDIDYLTHEVPRALEQSIDGIDRVARIVRAMKELSHPAGNDVSRIDLNHALDNAITVARNEWKYVAEVVTDFDDALPLVEGHTDQINQVLLNVIVNAAQAIADDRPDDGPMGTITARTRREGGSVEIRIEDTGGGIAPNVQPRIFEPFFTTKQVGRGTGQGLAIVYNVVVDNHRGTVQVESEVGEGAVFIIRLPIKQNESRVGVGP